MTLAALLNFTKISLWMLRNLDSVNQNPAVGKCWKKNSHRFVFQGFYPITSITRPIHFTSMVLQR